MKAIVFYPAFLILIFMSFCSSSQNINGRITDRGDEAVPNVLIRSISSGNHWHTNENGFFQISESNIPDTLIFTHLAYKEKSFFLSERDSIIQISIQLERKNIEIKEVSINGHLKSLNIISEIDLHTKPVNSSQEILRTVPGLIIGQHAGGGKAEQIFFRGFDIDHGTDIRITVDGLPVNMVSHAHGQAYADLHFLIPEIIGSIDFGKGPYYADKGNFNTSGYVEFKTKEKLDKSETGLEYGRFNTKRITSLINVLSTKKQNAYFAGEFLLTDGSFDAPQRFNRINVFGKYNLNLNTYDRLKITASHFSSKWDASGQIPQRAVDSGLIGRFGAIDSTEGGFTGRNNISLDHYKFINAKTALKTKLFYSNYDFELYSNFTFFLNDPENGDQIKQKENRQLYGAQSEAEHSIHLKSFNVKINSGIGFLYNDIDKIELSHTKNRKTLLSRIKYGDIDENNIYAFLNFEIDFGKLLLNPAVRFDYLEYTYVDMLTAEYTTLSDDQSLLCPKLNILYNQSSNFQLFIKTGIGFHSNDTRIILSESQKKLLPRAYGVDIGMIRKFADRIIMNSSLWYLFSEQEFIYVGDEGIVEPSGKSVRKGIDFGIRYQLGAKVFFNTDINYAFARSIEEPEGLNYIPLAPDLTTTGGIALRNDRGLSGSINYRYIKNRPANEDNSIIAKGYFIIDMNTTYSFKNFEIGFAVENLLNSDWNETQFATESRLYHETNSIEEIHFIPGTPFFIKGKIIYKF